MARKTAAVKTTTAVNKVVTAAKGVTSKVASSTPVRNTAIPKVVASAAPAKREISHQAIAVRAFEIAMGGTGGSELDNWYRAERELRAGL